MATPRQMELFNDRAFARNIKTVEREVIENYRIAVKAIRADIAKVYEKYAVNGVLTHAEMSKFNRLTSLERNLTRDIAPTLRKNAAITAKMKTVEYDEAFFRTAWTIDQQIGVSLNWGVLNPKAVTAAVANPLDLIARTRLRQGTLTTIRRAVAQGLIQGQSFPNMMRGVTGAINGSANDALRIVRTEGQRAQSQGQAANYDEAELLGVELNQIWDATLDDRTRDSHGRQDGDIRADDGKFSPLSGVRPRFPVDPALPAKESINCRCRIRGEIKDFAPKTRRVGGEIKSFETYTQWKERTGR